MLLIPALLPRHSDAAQVYPNVYQVLASDCIKLQSQ
jgi:hypothetical protein